MLCKFIASAIVAVFLVDQGDQAAETKSPESKPQAAASATKNDAADAKGTKNSSGDIKQAEKKPADPKSKDLIEVEKQIVEKTNAERARYGLPALVVDRNLIQSARTHAAWMTNSRNLQHTSLPVAENIAMGQRTSDEALSSWMGSSGHRANILNGGHKRIGVAAYRTPDGTIYWCQQFLP